jgi:prevent-host-death family protein
MGVSIRELKANLTVLIRKVQAGDTITVSVHGLPVARIVPITRSGGPDELARIPGIVWRGGKPWGLSSGQVLPRGVRLSDWVAEDRR